MRVVPAVVIAVTCVPPPDEDVIHGTPDTADDWARAVHPESDTITGNGCPEVISGDPGPAPPPGSEP